VIRQAVARGMVGLALAAALCRCASPPAQLLHPGGDRAAGAGRAAGGVCRQPSIASPSRRPSTGRSSSSRKGPIASPSTSSIAGRHRCRRASRARWPQSRNPARHAACRQRSRWRRASIRRIGSPSTFSASSRCLAKRSRSTRSGWCAGRAPLAPASGRSVLREPVQGSGYEALAAAHSRAIAGMSRDIASAIRAAAMR
jgi:hypothetical protein